LKYGEANTVSFVQDLIDFLLEQKSRGYSIVAMEQTSKSVPLNNFTFPQNVVLLLGDEQRGIPQDLLPLVDQCVEIPQFGVTRSLNVHVTGAMAIYEYVKQQLTK